MIEFVRGTVGVLGLPIATANPTEIEKLEIKIMIQNETQTAVYHAPSH